MAGIKLLTKGAKAIEKALAKGEGKVAKKSAQYGLPKSEKRLPMPAVRTVKAVPERHPIAENNLRIPLAEMSHTTEKTERLTPKRTIHPDELVKQRALIIPGAFDRSPTGVRLTHINEEPLDNPVEMKGGQDFGRAHEGQGPDTLIGKSGKAIIDKKAKETRLAAERFGEDRPILFSPLAMGWKGTDFNEMAARSVVERMKTAKMTEEDLRRMEMALQLATPEMAMPMPRFKDMWKYPDRLEEWLPRAGAGRTNLSTIPEKAEWQNLGATDIPSIRKANIDPDLFNANLGDTGRVFYQADPTGRVVTDPFFKRGDYDTGWGGMKDAEVLGFMNDIPADVMHPDAVAAMRANMLANGKDPNTLTMNNIMTGLERAAPVQEATPEWRDNIMRYAERHGMKMAIAAGMLTPAQAVTHFGYSGDGNGL